MAGFLTIVLVIFTAADIGSRKGDTILGLFLAFFTPMISFAPGIVMPALTGRVASKSFVWLSIVGGSAVGIICGIISVFLGGIWQWVAPDATFVVSWVFYLTGMLFGSREPRGMEHG